MLEQIRSAFSIGKDLINFWNWIRQSCFDTIRIETTQERGPTSREHGFTETAIKIIMVNRSKSAVRITDVRLMFCEAFGASVAPLAPQGRSHPELPVTLDSGEEENWYIPAEKLSGFLFGLHSPRPSIRSEKGKVTLYARCITSTGRVYKSSAFQFSTNTNDY